MINEEHFICASTNTLEPECYLLNFEYFTSEYNSNEVYFILLPVDSSDLIGICSEMFHYTEELYII
jgi:hypothetical protein